MSRSDNYVGLNPRAEELVKKLQSTEYGSFEGAFYNRFPLFAYSDKTEVRYIEYIQEEPWASGPHFFLALLDIHGNPIKAVLWTKEEIGKRLR